MQKLEINGYKLDMNNLFRLANLVVLPFWFMMIIFPNLGLTKWLMRSNLVFMLMGGIYSTLLIGGMRKSPGNFKDVMNPNLDGITKLLSSRQGAFAGWMHFLTFDLFVGRWIYFDSLKNGKPARLSILLTLMAGPLGLLFYLTFVRTKNNTETGV